MTDTSRIIDLGAVELSRAVHARTVSCREAMSACLARIHALNPAYRAIVNLAGDDVLLSQADAADAELAQGVSRGWLHGIPMAVKDAANVKGFPTTYGSRALKDAVAREDGLMAARLRAAGAIFIGKTNMPEFGLGSHTFNDLFGATPNPWDNAVSVGGSSGGAAAALALHMLPVADGSDYMGSLRNPAGWSNFFGMRPSQGRVPAYPALDVFIAQMATEGPMARSVADLAAMLATQSGYDARVPLSIGETLEAHRVIPAALKGLRVAWLGDLGGHLATDAGILAGVEAGLRRMEDAGAIVEPVAPPFDCQRVWEAWLVWRHALAGASVGAILAKPGARDIIKPEALWEYEEGKRLSLQDLVRAGQVRTQFYAQVTRLFERYDVLALPTAQVWPFPIAERWPKVIAGRAMDTYHSWMEVTLYATFAGLPAISVPSSFHANGKWPCGLQLIGPPQADAFLLRIAAAYELRIGDLLAKRPSMA
jgi:amidase